MKNLSSKASDHFLHPYVFLLKEGNQIKDNYLDYSLLMLQIGQLAILPSPHRAKNYRPIIHVQLDH